MFLYPAGGLTPSTDKRAHLAGAGDLDSALLAGAALHEVAAAARLVHQREAVERAHHAPIARVHHPLWRVALPCAHAAQLMIWLLNLAFLGMSGSYVAPCLHLWSKNN